MVHRGKRPAARPSRFGLQRSLRAGCIAGAFLLAAGCAAPKVIAVKTMKPILEDSSEEILRSRDLETVGRGLPAQIMTVQGLQAAQPGDTELTALAVQLHLFYAMGYVEDDDSGHAGILYTGGRDIGLQYFRCDDDLARAFDSKRVQVLEEALDEIDEDEAPLLLWTAACWGGWVRLNLDDPAAVADLPLVEALLERVIALAPETFHGMPYILRGTLLGLRPPALGGEPEAAREAFEDAFRISGRRFLLAQVYFARTYCKQIFDRELFVETLEEVVDAPPDLLPEVRLLNRLAKRQARKWLDRVDEIF
ncbi:MAG: hypothetical protein GF355_00280 [Candidatus Eisenbacteria bacterium]|nr:hypothetical protein [Candidatus Eisenbacteria bacterium]